MRLIRRVFQEAFMSRRWLLFLLCLSLIPLSFLRPASAGGELKVDEAATTILLQRQPVEVHLVVENSLDLISKANVHLEIIDPKDRVVSKSDQVASIAPGHQTVIASLPME